MSKFKIVFYADATSESVLLRRFDKWPKKVVDKFYVRIERLEELGHELRRPEADFLSKHLRVNYRILYFFSGKTIILFDGLTKEDIVPDKDIDRAVTSKALFEKDPTKHTYEIADNEN